MQLLVDPIVYALPSKHARPDAHIEYVRNLVLWFDEWNSNEHEFFISELCAFAVSDSEQSPCIQNIADLWKLLGETQIGHVDAYRVCKHLLENWPYLEDRIPGLRDIVIYDDHVHVRPDLLRRHTEQIRAAFCDTLGRVAYAKAYIDHEVVQDLLLVTHPIDRAKVANIDASAETNSETVGVSADLLLITEPEGLADLVDLVDIWQNTQQAINRKLSGLINEGALPQDTHLAKFYVSEGFNRSIQDYGINRRTGDLDRLFRKCVYLLAGLLSTNDKENHPLHKDERDGWGAWRLRISGGSLALRLHYWKKKDEYILTQVAPHENYDIADPKKVLG